MEAGLAPHSGVAESAELAELIDETVVELPIAPVDIDREAFELARTQGKDVAQLPSARPTVDIVLVSYNSRGDFERYFAGVEQAAARVGARIIVADNGSVDGSLDWVRAQDRRRIVGIDMGGNCGYAAAVNAAASLSDADYIVVLNPDIGLPEDDAIERLIDHLEEHPEAGAVAPRLLNQDGTTQESARIVPTLGMLAARQTPLGATGWGRKRAERYLELPDVTTGHAEVEWVLGAAIAMRRADFDAVGGWDDRYFLYFEDVDFCVQLHDRGRRVHYLADVELIHDHHRSSDVENGSAARSPARRAHIKSATRFFRKFPRYAIRSGLVENAATAGSALRRAFDIAAASTLLVLLAPLFMLIAIAIKLDSRGPVFFRQTRLGKGAREFTMLKFRSMHSEADETVHHNFVRRMITSGDAVAVAEGNRHIFKIYPDHRVTAVGRLIRRWSLDELPQLWNVLRGEMSLVGFRPPIPYELDYYPEEWHGRFAVKPGITGLWQVSGRNEKTYEEMVRYDIEYIETRNWKLDLVLLLKTCRVVLARRGAY